MSERTVTEKGRLPQDTKLLRGQQLNEKKPANKNQESEEKRLFPF
jgi:hypothetical protein